MDSIPTDTAGKEVQQVHLWNHCHNCDARPIVGQRFHCETCPEGPDNDLCEPCYELLQKGQIKHPADDSYAVSSVHGNEIGEHQFTVHDGKPITMYEEWLQISHPHVPDPVLPYPFIVRPVITAGMDSVIAGYAFVVKIEGYRQPVLLTALHVIDALIKQKGIDCTDKNKNYTGREIPAVITEVSLFDVCADNWMMAPLGTAGSMWVLPGAGTGDEEPYSDRDIAAFWVPPADAKNIKSAPLASQSPAEGEPVWHAARLAEKPGQELFKAVVVEVSQRSLVFKYEDPADKPKYLSGSPLVNQKGEVAAIIVGGGELNGQKLGHGNHVDNIRRHLAGSR
jgi:hypothetical protein